MIKNLILVLCAFIGMTVSAAEEPVNQVSSEVQADNTTETVVSRAELIEQKNKINALANELQRNVIANPNDDGSWFFLAQVLHDEGLHSDAMYAASQALKFYPDNADLNKIVLISSLNAMGEQKYSGGMPTEELLQTAINFETNLLTYTEGVKKRNGLTPEEWKKRQRQIRRQRQAAIARKAARERARANKAARARARANKAARERARANKAARERARANKAARERANKAARARANKATKNTPVKTVAKPKPKTAPKGSDPFKVFR